MNVFVCVYESVYINVCACVYVCVCVCVCVCVLMPDYGYQRTNSRSWFFSSTMWIQYDSTENIIFGATKPSSLLSYQLMIFWLVCFYFLFHVLLFLIVLLNSVCNG